MNTTQDGRRGQEHDLTRTRGIQSKSSVQALRHHPLLVHPNFFEALSLSVISNSPQTSPHSYSLFVAHVHLRDHYSHPPQTGSSLSPTSALSQHGALSRDASSSNQQDGPPHALCRSQRSTSSLRSTPHDCSTLSGQ